MRNQAKRQKTWSFLLLLFPFFLLAGEVFPQISITPLGAQPVTLLTEAFLGSGVSIYNVTYQGTGGSAATFTGGIAAVGFNDGVILSTGLAVSVAGVPADFPDTNLGTAGDADLQALNGGSAIFDATVLEFDFVPLGPVLNFRYVFASEEYNTYVGGNPLDQFGIFLDGSNIALLPGGVTRVGINTVNNCSNASYYINNAPDFSGACPVTAAVAGDPSRLDGLTTVLSFSVTLTAGVPHHLKVGVGDAVDRSLDTVVFLEAASLVAPALTATPTETPTGTPTSTPTATPTITLTPLPCPPAYMGPNPPGPGEVFTYPAPAQGGSMHFVYHPLKAGTVSIRVWTERGDLAAELSEPKPCGAQESLLDLSQFAAGVYFYRVAFRYTGGGEERLPTKKFMVRK